MVVFAQFFLLLLSYCLEVTPYILRRPCTVFGDFSIQQNKYMNTSVILNISNIEHDDCIIRCIQTTNCTSVNHEMSTKNCELLDQYLDVAGDRIGWSFYATAYSDPLNVGSYCLENKPCTIYERCIDACTPQKYQCLHFSNVATGAIASMSSDLSTTAHYIANNCIDGIATGAVGTFCISASEALPWFKIDLRKSYRIAVIRITTRTGFKARMQNFNVYIGNSVVFLENDLFIKTNQPADTTTYKNLAKTFIGRFIGLQDTNSAIVWLSLSEIEVFGIKSSEFNNL